MLILSDVSAEPLGYPALNRLCLSVQPGEVHALLGERRAGKSTVAGLLSGMVVSSQGSLSLSGKTLEEFSPSAMLRAGIRVFHQAPALIPSLSAWENILAGYKSIGMFRRSGRREAEALVSAMAKRWGLRLDPRRPVSRLSRIESSIVELARTLAFNPAIVFFDEPAGRFTADELQILYELIGEFKKAGGTVLYAATGVDEVLKVADQVSIMKAGRIVDRQAVRGLDREGLVDLAYSFRDSREELLSKNIRLLRYKKYSEEIISNFPHGALVLDQEGRLYLANRVALDLLSRDAGAGSEPVDLGLAFGQLQLERFLDVARSAQSRGWKRLPVKGGRYVDVTMFPFHDSEGRVLGSIMAMEDVSDIKVPPDFLVRAERAQSIADLTAGVAHEVNNPLGIISNYVELLLSRSPDAYASERLVIIRDEIRRISGIMTGLVSFSRVENDSMIHIDLAQIARECVVLLAYEAERRSIELKTDFGNGLAFCRANPGRLKQVFVNLMLNALEALGSGGCLTVLVRQEDDAVCAVIEDNGPGIPETLADSLFKPFSSGKSGDKHQGLGLSVSRHIVEAHGGRICCESGPERTAFTIWLPVA